MTCGTTEDRPRPEGGGVIAPALGGGSGAIRDASVTAANSTQSVLPFERKANRS